jgi:hypothetical protein
MPKPFKDINMMTNSLFITVRSKLFNTLNFENHSIIEEYKQNKNDINSKSLYYHRNIILERYLLRIIQKSNILRLNNEQKIKYEYNPYLLSFDSYATPDYWWLILAVNKISNVARFKNLPTKIRLPNIDDLKEVLQYELNVNKEIGTVQKQI